MIEIIPLEVLLAFKKGDHKAYERIFIAYFAKVKFFIERIIRSEDEAEELTQDLFVKLWVNREAVDINKSLASFLFTVAYNSALNFLKHKLVHGKFVMNYIYPDGANQTEEMIYAKEISLIIEMAVNKMPEQRRKIFQLSRIDGITNEEIASKLNISKKTVENQLSLVLKELRRIIYLFFIFFI